MSLGFEPSPLFSTLSRSFADQYLWRVVWLSGVPQGDRSSSPRYKDAVSKNGKIQLTARKTKADYFLVLRFVLVIFCRSLKKVKFPTDQFRPALGSCCRLIDWLLTMLKKPQNCPISDFFDLYPNTFCPYCLIQTWYRLLLTQYHQVPTSTAVYWPSTIMDQPLPPYTDPVPPSTNK